MIVTVSTSKIYKILSAIMLSGQAALRLILWNTQLVFNFDTYYNFDTENLGQTRFLFGHSVLVYLAAVHLMVM